jgi:hypothetical protein
LPLGTPDEGANGLSSGAGIARERKIADARRHRRYRDATVAVVTLSRLGIISGFVAAGVTGEPSLAARDDPGM